MGDFVPKWNFYQKSIQNPTKWLSSQMSKSRIFPNSHEFTITQFSKFSSRCDKKPIKDIYENLRIWGIHWTQYFFQKTKISSKICEEINFFLEFWSNIANIHNFDIWLLSQLVGLCVDFWSKFLLGTKSPMSGKRMSHRLSVIEKIQSQ